MPVFDLSRDDAQKKAQGRQSVVMSQEGAQMTVANDAK